MLMKTKLDNKYKKTKNSEFYNLFYLNWRIN